ncbi:hypothetical protein BH20ACI1_BH20ACI1_06300 [soil metagenome]
MPKQALILLLRFVWRYNNTEIENNKSIAILLISVCCHFKAFGNSETLRLAEFSSDFFLFQPL